MSSDPFRALVVAGLPRCGTTLLSTFLAGQRHVTFLTDYLSSFTDALSTPGVSWDTPLTLTQRRVALAKVRDQLLRFRHPVLVSPSGFTTVAELHRGVLAELARAGDRVVGHKLVLDAPDIPAFLAGTACTTVVLYRDPRDAALSWFHRVGGDVEGYLERWLRMIRLVREVASPRFVALGYEDLVRSPAQALAGLFAQLGLPLDVERAELVFRGPRGSLPFQGNAGVGKRRVPFDARALGQWRSRMDSPVVRYAATVASAELERLGYEAGPTIGHREALRWRLHRRAHRFMDSADRVWRRTRAQVLTHVAAPLRPNPDRHEF